MFPTPSLAPIQGWFLLYPSLAFTLALLLPLSWACNWLKRHAKFDFPQGAAADHAKALAAAQQQGQGGEGLNLKRA